MKIQGIGLAIVAVAVGLALPAKAALYGFTFTGDDGMDATGTIDVESGVAQYGSIDVTGIPVEADPSTLVSAGGSLLPGNGSAQNPNGDNLPYDNLVNFANDPILTSDGMDFASGQYGPTQYNTLIGLWGGDVNGNVPPYAYTLFVGEAEVDGNGNVLPGENEYVYTDTLGTLSLTPIPVPEPGTIFAGLGVLGYAGFFLVRRSKSVVA